MSQYNYIDFYLDVNGNIEESNLSQITQHSTNTIVRVLSEGLNVDSVFFSFKQVDGTALPKKLALLQPSLLEGYKVWQYRLTESDTALANPSPSPFKLTISLKKDDITNQLPEQTLTIVRSLQSAIVIPDASSIDGISDGFNAISEEVLRLDGMRDIGIENIVDNGDGTITIEYGDNELRTSNLTGPQGPVGPTGADGADGANAVLPTNLNNFNIGTATGTGYSFKNPDGSWVLLNLDADLTFIAGLNGTGFLKRTGVNTWALDTNEYISSLSVSAPLTISGTGNSRTIAINAVSQTNAGVMGISDKIKLDGIATNANNYVHPTFTAVSIDTDGFEVLDTLTTNTDGHVTTATKRALPTITVAKGGTGLTTLPINEVLLGNGTNVINTRTVSDSTSAGALTQSTNFVTERDVYYGLPTINGDHTYTSATTLFAPTSAGIAGYTLKSAGVGDPFWDIANNHTHGVITSNGFTTEGVANRVLTTTTSGQITTRDIVDSTIPLALSVGTGLVTERDVYYAQSWVNNQRQSSDISRDIWAPTTGGTSGQILKSNGTSAPSWIDAPGLVQFGLNTTHIRTLTGAATDMIGSDTGHPFTINVGAYKGILFKFCRRFGISPNFTWICDYAVVPNNPNDSGINISFDVNDSIILTSSKELRRGDLQTFNQTFATIVRTSTSNTSLSLTARMSYCNNEDEIRIYGIS
jgi:hypothetical protein